MYKNLCRKHVRESKKRKHKTRFLLSNKYPQILFFMQVAIHTKPEGHFEVWASPNNCSCGRFDVVGAVRFRYALAARTSGWNSGISGAAMWCLCNISYVCSQLSSLSLLREFRHGPSGAIHLPGAWCFLCAFFVLFDASVPTRESAPGACECCDICVYRFRFPILSLSRNS